MLTFRILLLDDHLFSILSNCIKHTEAFCDYVQEIRTDRQFADVAKVYKWENERHARDD